MASNSRVNGHITAGSFKFHISSGIEMEFCALRCVEGSKVNIDVLLS